MNEQLASNLPALISGLLGLFLILMAWSMVWKGWALWIAARSGSKVWFVVFLLVNTVGILEILYIFWFSKMKCECGHCAKCLETKVDTQPKLQ